KFRGGPTLIWYNDLVTKLCPNLPSQQIIEMDVLVYFTISNKEIVAINPRSIYTKDWIASKLNHNLIIYGRCYKKYPSTMQSKIEHWIDAPHNSTLETPSSKKFSLIPCPGCPQGSLGKNRKGSLTSASIQCMMNVPLLTSIRITTTRNRISKKNEWNSEI